MYFSLLESYHYCLVNETVRTECGYVEAAFVDHLFYRLMGPDYQVLYDKITWKSEKLKIYIW